MKSYDRHMPGMLRKCKETGVAEKKTGRRGSQRSIMRQERLRGSGLQAFAGTLASTLSKTGSHWKVSSREVARFDLYLKSSRCLLCWE